MIDWSEVTGVVLAGGKSTRIGLDKALLTYRPTTFLWRTIHVLRQVFTWVMIISDMCDGYGVAAVSIYPDNISSSGPLAGIHSALSHSLTPEVIYASSPI